MHDNSFILINGRSYSDHPAQFTFVSHLGKSINDLIWCNNANMDDIYDLKILNNISMSDHFPVLLQLNFDYQHSTCNFSNSIANKVDVCRWDSNKSVLYKEFMMYSDKVSSLSKSSDIMFENFLNTLTYAATCLGLKHEKIVYNKSNYSSNKPWYDLELKTSKKNSMQAKWF